MTCLGVLGTAHIAFDAYMPVMLAIMEIPGCLVALYLVSRLRHEGMDALGNMPGDPGYDPSAKPLAMHVGEPGHHATSKHERDVEKELELALEKMEHPQVDDDNGNARKKLGLFNRKLLHEVFLNTGLYLLFGGIVIGTISGSQGESVTRADDSFFVTLFQGVLCLFLLEMGMTASRKLKDLKTGGPGFIAFALARAQRVRHVRDHRYPRLCLPDRHALRAGLVRAVRGALRGGVLHRGPGGSAAGDPRSQPHAAAGGVAGLDVFVQRHDRHSGLHRDRPAGHEGVSYRLKPVRTTARVATPVEIGLFTGLLP